MNRRAADSRGCQGRSHKSSGIANAYAPLPRVVGVQRLRLTQRSCRHGRLEGLGACVAPLHKLDQACAPQAVNVRAAVAAATAGLLLPLQA